ncbi:class I SAM-dependent methyltransferase [Actinophytocola xanthii]|uniref:Ubiquinone biosynthesis protein n=1 Tax=Actinophytocola xanthii TaxID=1912961 RepID=A0A1Q8CQL0_9PSEU|nr:class I SAM-dependent methyltransferase [Actinophytocola xanthii]OLF16639.1 ubiquinone biosynthesis protein [Actinophytocola xanthii]
MSTWATAAGRVPGAVYDFGVQRPWLAVPAGWLLWGTDVRHLHRTVRGLADLPAGSSVLDVPCGGGIALRGLRRGQDVRYVGADVSPAMLARTRRLAARSWTTGVALARADLTRLPFATGAFDSCLCLNGLHCLPDPARAVRELARCLRPGGRLVGDLVVSGAGVRQDLALAVLRRLGLFGPGGTPADLGGWLAAAHLRVDRILRSGAVVHFVATRRGTRHDGPRDES